MARVPKCTDTDKGAHIKRRDDPTSLRPSNTQARSADQPSVEPLVRHSRLQKCRYIGQDCLVKAEMLVAFKEW
jgi:hypothetical protein